MTGAYVEMINDGYSLVEYEDYWRVPLVGRTVSRFLIDNMVSIGIIDPDREYVMITVEQEFCLTVRGKEYTLSPKEPTQLGPLFILLHKTIKAVSAFKNGVLEIEFATDDKLRVSPHPKYEAWGIVGDRGLRVIAVPGSDLAVWKPK